MHEASRMFRLWASCWKTQREDEHPVWPCCLFWGEVLRKPPSPKAVTKSTVRHHAVFIAVSVQEDRESSSLHRRDTLFILTMHYLRPSADTFNPQLITHTLLVFPYAYLQTQSSRIQSLCEFRRWGIKWRGGLETWTLESAWDSRDHTGIRVLKGFELLSVCWRTPEEDASVDARVFWG